MEDETQQPGGLEGAHMTFRSSPRWSFHLIHTRTATLPGALKAQLSVSFCSQCQARWAFEAKKQLCQALLVDFD